MKKKPKLPPHASVNSYELPPSKFILPSTVKVTQEIRDLMSRVSLLVSLLPACRLRDDPANPQGQPSSHRRARPTQRTISLTEKE